MTRYQKMKRKTSYMLLKLDFEKAFDQLEWSFIHCTLIILNLPPNFIKLIMSCVTTTSMAIQWISLIQQGAFVKEILYRHISPYYALSCCLAKFIR